MRTLKVVIVTSSLLAIIAVSTIIVVFFMADKSKQESLVGSESAWKTYEHSKYRIRYPADYVVEAKGDTASFYAPWEIKARAMPNYTDQPLGYHITMSSAHSKYSIEQWLQRKYKHCIGSYCTIEKKSVGAAGLPGYLVHEAGLADGYYSVFLKSTDTIFEFTAYWGSEITNQDSTFNMMLSSFELNQ